MRALVTSCAAALALGAAGSAGASVVMEDGSGRVEVIAKGQSRGLGILPGEPLGAGTLALGPEAHAIFKTSDGATLELSAATRAQLNSGQATQVELAAGTVTAAVGAHPVRVQAAGGLLATASGGKFEVALASDGSVKVVSQQGPVELRLGDSKSELGSGKSIELAKGEPLPALTQAPAAPVAAARPAAKLPEPEKVAMVDPAPVAKQPKPVAEQPEPAAKPVAAVAPKPEKAKPAPVPVGPPTLNVKWPASAVALSYTLRGKVSPGATVSVNNVAAEVRKSGSFTAKIELPEGESIVEVKAVGPDGQELAQKHAVTAAEPPMEAPAPAKPAAPVEAQADDDAPPAKPAKVAKPAAPKPAGNAAKPQVTQEAAGWE